MQQKWLHLVDNVFFVLIAYWSNLTNFSWYYAYFEYSGSPLSQLLVLFFMVLVIFWLLKFEKIDTQFIRVWKKNWVIALFICLAFLSLFWTVDIPFTIYQAFLALFTTLIAAYLGIRYSSRNLVFYVAITVGIFAIISLFLVIVDPKLAIHNQPFYEGLWRGAFWHKIYLGATMALGYIAYLVILFSSTKQYSVKQKIFAGLMIPLCLVNAIKSDSASGLVVFVLQTGIFVVVYAWLRWGKLISRRGYRILGVGIAFVILLLIANLDHFFKIFNRSTSLTGRIPMWEYLLKTFIVERPLLGYGFGAFWQQTGITKVVQSAVKWYYPVIVSDNGYLDILLGLGIIGLILLFIILGTALLRSFRVALIKRDLTAFFPVFVLSHILLINISLSYFFENEVFIWFLLVFVLFNASSYQKEEVPAGT